ncbi:MAG: CDC48 family AAA ATPase [Candidatus Heimdallarchaeota archaeon]|nr:CDC48 family AAA ATPase [Candidatus Heimdallarchaeota archaeon]
MTEIKLKVEEAKKSDIGKQIARIHVEIAEKLGVKTGDIIAIKGKKKTFVRVWRNKSPIVNENSIRIESIIRRNADVKLDDYVTLEKSNVNLGESITIGLFEKYEQTKELLEIIQLSLKEKILSNNLIWHVKTGFAKTIKFKVISTLPEEPIIFTEKTKIILADEPNVVVDDLSELKIEDQISYEDIGGLDEVVKKLREMIELPLRFPEIFERVGIQPPRGVLLYGPPGTGKTILARAVANETNSYFINISGPEIMSKYFGEAESKLREIFQNAQKQAPSIIFIDEIDSIAPNRDNSSSSAENRIVAQLLTLMDGIEARHNVVVIAATNRPNAIDPALRRGGRFDREIEIGIPDENSRKDILEIQTRGMPLEENVDLDILAKRTQGFVGADINILVKEAALHSIQRVVPELELGGLKEISIQILQKIIVTMEDFDKALTEVSPSSLREVIIEVPSVTWDAIGGLKDIKLQLKESLEWPILHADLYKQMNIKSEKGILLYGPPGTGKTMLAKAIANEINMNFISIKGPELISKWVGETEKAIREIFRKARSASPCIIFFDEIDSIASTRSMSNDSNDLFKRIVSQLLTEIDGVEETKGIMVLAATNRPDLLDTALIRPGRFDRLIFVGLPDYDTRIAIIEVELKNTPTEEGLNVEELARKTEKFSAAEIVQILHKAKIKALKDHIQISKKKENSKLILKFNDLIEVIQSDFNKPKEDYTYHPPSISDMNDINIA